MTRCLAVGYTGRFLLLGREWVCASSSNGTAFWIFRSWPAQLGWLVYIIFFLNTCYFNRQRDHNLNWQHSFFQIIIKQLSSSFNRAFPYGLAEPNELFKFSREIAFQQVRDFQTVHTLSCWKGPCCQACWSTLCPELGPGRSLVPSNQGNHRAEVKDTGSIMMGEEGYVWCVYGRRCCHCGQPPYSEGRLTIPQV